MPIPGALTLAEMVAQLEREEFDKWLKENDEALFDASPHTAAWMAWQFRGASLSKCRGMTRPGCNYLAPCGHLCNKCGRKH